MQDTKVRSVSLLRAGIAHLIPLNLLQKESQSLTLSLIQAVISVKSLV